MERVVVDPRIEVTQWVAPELGNSSYRVLLPDSRTAAVVDPVRDAYGYLADLGSQEDGQDGRRWTWKALETHIHNDFVSGGRELAAAVGAEVATGTLAELSFEHRALRDAERIALGEWELEALATPGHTPEHVSYLLRDPEDRPRALFSGGALMVGGAARTDLFGPARARPLARDLYRSLHERLRKIPSDVLLLPTHGGGSFCATGTGDRRRSTLREERSTNPLLRARSMEEFVARILEQGPFPRYYLGMRKLNSGGAPVLGPRSPQPRALPLDRFDRLRAEGAAVIDTRPAEAYDAGHIPGSLAVDADGPLSAWVGWLLPPMRPLVLLSSNEREAEEAGRQLFRIGFDLVQGALAGGLATWKAAGRALQTTRTVRMRELARLLSTEESPVVVDVRESHEWFEGHIPGSLNLPLAALLERSHELPRDTPLAVHCAAGYRATVAASLLEQAGFSKVLRGSDGYEAWKARNSSRLSEVAPQE